MYHTEMLQSQSETACVVLPVTEDCDVINMLNVIQLVIRMWFITKICRPIFGETQDINHDVIA